MQLKALQWYLGFDSGHVVYIYIHETRTYVSSASTDNVPESCIWCCYINEQSKTVAPAEISA